MRAMPPVAPVTPLPDAPVEGIPLFGVGGALRLIGRETGGAAAEGYDCSAAFGRGKSRRAWCVCGRGELLFSMAFGSAHNQKGRFVLHTCYCIL